MACNYAHTHTYTQNSNNDSDEQRAVGHEAKEQESLGWRANAFNFKRENFSDLAIVSIVHVVLFATRFMSASNRIIHISKQIHTKNQSIGNKNRPSQYRYDETRKHETN